MTVKKELSVKVTITQTEQIVILSESDFTNINSKSPVSNFSEVERLNFLDEQVKEAKAALDTFSSRKESILGKYKKLFF